MRHPFGRALLSWLLTSVTGSLIFITEILAENWNVSGGEIFSMALVMPIVSLIASLPAFIIFYLIARSNKLAFENGKKRIILCLIATFLCLCTLLVFCYATGWTMMVFLSPNWHNPLIALLIPYLIPFIACIFIFDFSDRRFTQFDFEKE